MSSWQTAFSKNMNVMPSLAMIDKTDPFLKILENIYFGWVQHEFN